jgi:hypothetical protein
MTRKHYTELAKRFGQDLAIIGNDTPKARACRSGYIDAMKVVMDTLRAENPRFDRERFTAAVDAAELALAERCEVAK